MNNTNQSNAPLQDLPYAQDKLHLATTALHQKLRLSMQLRTDLLTEYLEVKEEHDRLESIHNVALAAYTVQQSSNPSAANLEPPPVAPAELAQLKARITALETSTSAETKFISQLTPVVTANLAQLERDYPGYGRSDYIDTRHLKDLPMYDRSKLIDEFVRDFELWSQDRYVLSMYKKYFIHCFSACPIEKSFIHEEFIVKDTTASWHRVKQSVISRFSDVDAIESRDTLFGSFEPTENEKLYDLCHRFLKLYRDIGRDSESPLSKADIHVIAKWIPSTLKETIRAYTKLRGAQTIHEYCTLVKSLNGSALAIQPSHKSKQKEKNVKIELEDKSKLFCSYHGWKGHTTADCKVLHKRKKLEEDDPSPPKKPRTETENICRYCNKVPYTYAHGTICREQNAKPDLRDQINKSKELKQNTAIVSSVDDFSQDHIDRFYEGLNEPHDVFYQNTAIAQTEVDDEAFQKLSNYLDTDETDYHVNPELHQG